MLRGRGQGASFDSGEDANKAMALVFSALE